MVVITASAVRTQQESFCGMLEHSEFEAARTSTGGRGRLFIVKLRGKLR